MGYTARTAPVLVYGARTDFRLTHVIPHAQTQKETDPIRPLLDRYRLAYISLARIHTAPVTVRMISTDDPQMIRFQGQVCYQPRDPPPNLSSDTCSYRDTLQRGQGSRRRGVGVVVRVPTWPHRAGTRERSVGVSGAL